MWYPKTAKELEEAIADSTLPREPTGFELKSQLPEQKANPEIAVDVAAMATAGGYIVYGVKEHKEAGTFEATPIELQGVKERIGQIVGSYAQERIEFEVYELPLEDDPSRGYVVVEVPASARAPHMVESRGHYRFYGRQPGGNRILSEAEVALLYERRQRVEEAALKALDEAIMWAPMRVAGRADLHVVVVPMLSDSGVRERAMQGVAHPLLFADVMEAFNAIRFKDPCPPQFQDALSGAVPTRTVAGFAAEVRPEPENPHMRSSRIEFLDDGTLRYFQSGLTHESDDELVFHDLAVAHLVTHACRLAGQLLDRGGYFGAVEVLVAVMGAHGGVSPQWRRAFHAPPMTGKPAVQVGEYRRHVRVPASKLLAQPMEVSRVLTMPLLLTVRPDGFADPFEAH
jgi:hypothetical protein